MVEFFKWGVFVFMPVNFAIWFMIRDFNQNHTFSRIGFKDSHTRSSLIPLMLATSILSAAAGLGAATWVFGPIGVKELIVAPPFVNSNYSKLITGEKNYDIRKELGADRSTLISG